VSPDAAEPPPRLLLLGGSTEASTLAARLTRVRGLEVILSLAGRTAAPRASSGPVRIGGFGGVDGLARWLEAQRIAVVVDATHPFASQMPWHAAQACTSLGVPRLRLRRPGWTPEAGDRWVAAPGMEEAARAVATVSSGRVFLTVGGRQLAAFAGLSHLWFLVRSIEPPEPMPLARRELLVDRGPFDRAGEHALMVSRRIDTLVTRNSGGSAVAAKLSAARRLEMPVVMVERPPPPAGPLATTVDEAVRWCAMTLGRWGTPHADHAPPPGMGDLGSLRS
jgi:precorrin-6A/cobalt-precorrin-6A reductase